MKKLKTFILLFIFALTSSMVMAAPQQLQIQYDEKFPSADMPSSKVLTGGVSQVQELPSGMYGMWQVNGTLLETNDYERYTTHSSDIWVLRKDGNFVTLMNPQNGASATITVTAVQNNTATFTRGVQTYVSNNGEKVTLTLENENTFSGIDVITSEINQFGVPIKSFARYKLNGTKLSGQAVLMMKRPRFMF